MIITTVLFYFLSAVLLASSLVVITAKNPVHSVLFLILAFFNSAGLFLMLGAEFISMLMIIVYVGAVAVLFLFVVMMLDIDYASLKVGFMKHLPLGLLVAVIMFTELYMVLDVSVNTSLNLAGAASPMPFDVENTKALGAILYTDYILPFQVCGLILLVAMVGAITLTLRTRPGVRKQDISQQLKRSRKDGVELVKVQSGKGV